MSKYDKASLVMIPSAYKTGSADNLYSVLPVNGNGDFTLDRNNGTATRVNKDGYIETVAGDTPRLDYPLIDGVVQDCPALLLEPQRTNTITYSEDFSQSVWNQIDVTIDSGYTAPDGTNTAFKVTENGSNAHLSGFSDVNTGKHKSIWAKTVSGTGVIQLLNQHSDTSNIFTITEQWQRFDVAHDNGFDYFYLCDFRGASTTLTEVILWGAQSETGSYATSYIPTSGSSVTRSAETCNSAGTSAEFNGSEGVVYLELKPIAFDSTHKRVVVSDGTITNRIIMGIDSSNNVLATVYDGSNQAVLGGNYDGKENFQKVALKYKANDFSLYFNGFEVATDSSGVTYSANTLTQISYEDANNTLNFYGRIKETGVFKEALTDSELEALTSWDSFTEMATGQEYSIR